nr:deleted in lung and esophageal cancer protein 1 isoform X1 [Ciona intestinalis]|eukprot:XP_026694559.1 deleted in lung and esophageal cancer protein 1 isoform X1 [Ciona intestinalis]
MSKETVNNLTVSGDGSTKFHKKCMNQLHQVHLDHKKKLEEFNAVERQIMQARAQAVTADERALNKLSSPVGCETYEKLGLPSVPSNFQWCLDESTIKKHKLLVPTDFFGSHRQSGESPKRRKTPHFSLPTVSSSLHILNEPVDDGYTDLKEEKSNMVLLEEQSLTTLSSDSAELVSIPPQQKIKSKKKKSKQDKWREEMNHGARIEERSLLARLDERHNFLKNPRFIPLDESSGGKLLTKIHPKQVVVKAGREITQDVASAECIQVFASNPGVVQFNEWIVGRVYEVNLELRNISTVSRQLRVLPPKSSYFSLGLGKFPGQHGVVAPGMCAQYSVRYMPDALADADDHLEVISQSEEPLIVPIKAHRIPPVLVVSKTIDCGFCLVGGVKVVDLPLKNIGGNGRFCILKSTSWPAANFKTVVNPSCLDLGVFQIRPAVFEVLASQVTTLELLFSPQQATTYKEELVIVCDNCQVQYVTIQGHGESAAVELVSVSNNEEEVEVVGEITDRTADHLIRFPPLNPHSYFMRQIIVHNSTNVEMPYTWHILKPNLSPGLESLSSSKSSDVEKLDFFPDPESCFYIEPRSGFFQPNAIHEFVLTFAPDKVGNYNNTLHLVLSDIPESQNIDEPTSAGGVKPNIKRLASENAVDDKLNVNKPESNNHARAAIQGKQISNSLPALSEVIAMEIETKASCVPYSVVLHPPAVIMPGSILVGTTVKRPLQMANYSLAPINFKWDCVTSPNIVEVEPAIGMINPGDVAQLQVTVTGLNPGLLSCNVLCNIQHQSNPISIVVSSQIRGPNVVIDNVSIDFGLIKVGSKATQKLYIRNTTQLNASWKLNKSLVDSKAIGITPSSGELPSLAKQEVTVTFNPMTPSSLNTTITLDVEGGESSSVAVKSEVQNTQVCFEECLVVLKETFVSVPQTSSVVLLNQTLFPTKFSFQELKGKQSEFCDVTVFPNKGILGPHERLELQVTFQCREVVEINEVYLPCYIEEMKNPIVLGFYSNVNALSVTYATPCANCEDLKLDFVDVEVSSIQTLQVVLTNLTAIRAPWSAYVTNFFYKPSAPHPPPQNFKSVKSRRAMLGRTPNLADPLAKTNAQTIADKCKRVLSSGLGAAFLLDPPSGKLGPYQSQVINISAYNNMWGKYEDTFVCDVEGLESQLIPISMNVIGCPLKFQIANQSNEGTVLRYGTHLDGDAPVARKVRINNTSCCDVRIDWQTFNYPEPSDHKLVDLNIWFGEAFPSKQQETKPHTSETNCSTTPEKNNLVRVRIESHDGQKSNVPFHIEPDQIVIPAQSHNSVSVMFQPTLGTNCDTVMEKAWNSFALGYLTICSNTTNNNTVIREDKYDVDPMRLEMTSFVRIGQLSIEADDDDDDCDFIVPMHQLLCDRNERTKLRSISLTNFTETCLSFGLSLKSPFFFRSSVMSQECQNLARNRLNPQSNIKVQVGFRVMEKFLEDLKTIESGQEVSGVRVCHDDLTGTSKLEYKDELTIRYNNGVNQCYPLLAFVHLPSFNLSQDSIEFGVCFVDQEQLCYVTITNPSYSESHWSVEALEPIDHSKGEVVIEPTHGVLEASESFTSKNKTKLAVRFIPRSESNFEYNFMFKGKLHEEFRFLKVKASGSYDGQFERKL